MAGKSKGGRPTKMTRVVVTEICQRLSGGESLVSICADERMPARSTVLLAVVDDRDGFRTEYMRAREAAGFAHGDTIVEITESVRSGALDPQSAKVMIDGMKWAAERMAPKHHSPRQEHTSPDGSMSPKVIDASKLSDAALAELMNARRTEDQ